MKKSTFLIALVVAIAGLTACKNDSGTGPIIPPPPTVTATISAAVGWSVPVTINVNGTFNLHLGCGDTPGSHNAGPAELIQVKGPGSYMLTEIAPGSTGMCGNVRSVMVITTGRNYREEVFQVPGTFPGPSI